MSFEATTGAAAAPARWAAVAAVEALFAVVLLAVYWLPALLGGDYGAGDYEWTAVRVLSLALLVALGAGALWLARKFNLERVVVGPLLVAASSLLVGIGLAVSAAWVQTPPLTALGLGAALGVAPIFARGRVGVAIGCAVASTALVSYWMACFPPY